MTRYLTGILLLAAALVPVQMGAHLWRKRLIGEWYGAPATLVEIIMDLTTVVLVSEILGSVNLYRVVPVVAALAVVGGVAIWTARRQSSSQVADLPNRPDPLPDAAPRAATIGAVIAACAVLAEWSTQTAAAYHHGMLSADTLWYHMPFAARFVQDHSVTGLHYVDAQAVTVFFPASSELFHSLGILIMGNDVLSPLLNTLWLALALLASWCIGRPYGVAPITLTGSAILFATPGLVATQPGGAYDDIVGLALILSAVAFLINSQSLSKRARQTAWVMAATSTGLAVGTKWTLLGPAAALTVGACFIVVRGRRIRSLGIWLVALLLAGGFWYGRNAIAVGNPIPPLHLKLGPLSLPSPRQTTPSSTVVQYIFNSTDWHQYFVPGLRLSFGPAWWGLLGLSVLGLVLAVVTGTHLQRILGLVGIVSGVIFMFTPQYLSAFGSPVFFVYNVRYADAALIVGLVLLPINPLLSTWQRCRWILAAYLAVLVATQFDAAIWPTTFFTQHFLGGPVRGFDSLIGLIIGVIALVVGMVLVLRRDTASSRRPVFAWIVVGALVIIAGFPLQQTYLRDRYVHSAGGVAAQLASWFQTKNNIRVGVIGQFSYLQYPYYGRDLSNYVQYLGVRGPHGSYGAFNSCEEWRDAITSGHYSYVVITTDVARTRSAVSSASPPETRWMGGNSRIILQGQLRSTPPFPGYLGYSLYKVDPNFSADGCGG